jgi:hypothetical protein
MNPTQFKIAAASLLPAVATMLFVQACGGGGDAVAQTAPDPLEGVWEAVVTQQDCTTHASIATFKGAQAMHRGGTLTDTSAGPPTARGTGIGTWSRNADGTYAVKFRFYRFNTDGTLAGNNVVTSTRTLSADGSSYSGTTKNEVRDLAGNVLSTVCVSDVATRFN